ncbi:MAG: hypothetical protein ACXVQV_08375 [Actinomycetota bacterium]
MAEDPGWLPALGGFWRMLFVPTLFMRTRRVKALPLLVVLRSTVIVSLVSWLVFLDLLRYLQPQARPNNARIVGLVVIGDGLLGLLVASRLPYRMLRGKNPTELAMTYRAVFFMGWALANSVVLFGFVGFFLTGRFWMYALSLPFGLLGLAMITPSRARIEHDQGRLRAGGSKLQLIDALMLPSGDVPNRPKRR